MARDRADQAVEPRKRMRLYVALVQSEGELVDVAVEMLIARVVIDAVQAALHHRPYALNAVRRLR